MPSVGWVYHSSFGYQLLGALDGEKKSSSSQESVERKRNGPLESCRVCVFLAKSVSFFVLSSVVSSALFYAFPLSLYIVSMQLSLLLATILRARDGVVVTFGLVCSSFVSISRGSTYRSYFRPEGDPSSKSVQRGNLLAARIGLNNLKPQSNMIMVIDSDQDLLLYMCSISKR